MTHSVSRRTVLTGTAAALPAASLVGVGESPAAASATAPGPKPLVPLRIPKLDQGMWQQPDAAIQWLRDGLGVLRRAAARSLTSPSIVRSPTRRRRWSTAALSGKGKT